MAAVGGPDDLIILLAVAAPLARAQDGRVTPLFGIGMGIVPGDSRLLRQSLRTTMLGMLLAIAISMAVSLLIPEHKITAQMLGRCSPTLLDLAVALVSGAAAAYASARKNAAGALSGVAIAVALVPPLATFGLLAASGQMALATGALLLFLTNLVAIVSAVAAVFLWVGFRPNTAEGPNARTFRSGSVGSLVLLGAITVILGTLTARSYHTARLNATIEALLARQVATLGPDAELEKWEPSTSADGVLTIKARIAAEREIAPAQAQALQIALSRDLGEPVALLLQILPTTYLEPLATE